MSKVERIETEIGKLSPAQRRRVREWIDGLLEESLLSTGKSAAKVQLSARQLAESKPTRVRRAASTE